MEEQRLEEIKTILKQFPDLAKYQIFIFGSRAMGNPKKYSDFDIGIEGNAKVPAMLLADLEDAFEKSDLPYTVDLVDFSYVDQDFKSVAKSRIIPLKLNFTK